MVHSISLSGDIGELLLGKQYKKIRSFNSEEVRLVWNIWMNSKDTYFEWEFVDYIVCRSFNYVKSNIRKYEGLPYFKKTYVGNNLDVKTFITGNDSDKGSSVNYEITAVHSDKFVGEMQCTSIQLKELSKSTGRSCFRYLHTVKESTYKVHDLVNLDEMRGTLEKPSICQYSCYIKRLSGEIEKVLCGDDRVSFLKILFVSVVNYLKLGSEFDGSEDRLRLFITVENEKVLLLAQKVGVREYNTYCYKKDFGFIKNIYERSDREIEQIILKNIGHFIRMSSESIKVIIDHLFNIFVKYSEGSYIPLIYEGVKIGNLSFINYIICG